MQEGPFGTAKWSRHWNMRHNKLKAVRTWSGLIRIATETEAELLQEAVEWRSFRKFASQPN
jgi:hypothetical protein